MITNIDIDEQLVAEAMKLSGARSKREVVDRALRDLVARAKRPRLRDVWGRATEETYWPDYDPKTGPGEPAGAHRVEQGIARYRIAPAPPAPAASPAPAATPAAPPAPPAPATPAAPAAPAKSRKKS